MGRRTWSAVAAGALGLTMFVAGPARAETVVLEDYVMNGGENTRGELSNTGQYDQCSSDDDWFSVEEGYWHRGEDDVKGDTWDGGLSFAVNSNPFNDQDGSGEFTSDATGETILAGPETIAGLDVSVEHLFFASRPTVRSLLTLENPGDTDVTVTVTFDSSVGSDESTDIRGTSDGDNTFTTDDRWIVTSDDPTSPGDPVATHVLYGEGAEAPVNTVRKSPDDDEDTTFGENCVWVEYEVTVPAGETVYLMTFGEQRGTNEDAIAHGPDFDDLDVDSELLTGLSEETLRQIVNWGFLITCPGFDDAAGTHIVGTARPDVLEGTAGRDVICGLEGDDTLRGFRGNDVLVGGDGDDSMAGGAGADDLRGMRKSDQAYGGWGADDVAGGAGSDMLFGRAGADDIRGGAGLDDLQGGTAFDALNGGPYKDFCDVGPGGGTEVKCEG